tara:strand:- start:610 stop:780 length:171 start_codon:yes stop_codon:yes gene_type:complete
LVANICFEIKHGIFTFNLGACSRKTKPFCFLNLLFNKNITKLNFYLTIAIDGQLIY